MLNLLFETFHAPTPSVAQHAAGQRGLTLPLGAYATQIRNARLWRTNDKLRLVLDLSGPVQYKTFTLTAPDRLIIDVSGSRLTGDFSQLALDRTVIKSIRSGHYGGVTTRASCWTLPHRYSSTVSCLVRKAGRGIGWCWT